MANDDDNVLQNDTASTQSVSETTANIPLPILPEELIIDILLRLPVKSLLQFKCVCKSWKTLISDPQFAKNQLRISTAYPRLISAVRIDGHCKNVSYPVEPLLEQENQSVNPVISNISYEYNIIGSCNGLLCLLDWNHRFRLWNPSIKLKSKSKRSPTISSFVRPRIAHFGFGYDHVNDKYKVLASVYNTNKYNNGQIFTGIYTFGGDDDSWRNIQDFPCHPSFKMGICVRGTLNWVVRRSVNFYDGVILSFDLENETYREILLPRLDVDEDDVYTTARMEVLNNCLCVCFGSFASNNPHWTVWMMKEFGAVESWTKLFTIPLWSCPSTSIEPYIVQPLFISENGIFLMKDKGDQLALYNFREGGLHIQLISTEFGLNMQHIFIYHESLVSPRCW